MSTSIDQTFLDDLGISSEDLRMDIAVGMYASHRITLGRAANIAGLDQMRFQKHLQSLGIPLHYDETDWADDLRMAWEKTAS